MRFQPIYDIAEICARKGVQYAVLCPGSRCAPLVLSFSAHPAIKKYIFPDERSAGFVALGIAQQATMPAVLICTSGTAVYNFAPAVAEAFFNQTPLILLTADRPAEWVNQHDGQTIYQAGIFGAHVKKSYQLPQNYDHPDDQWFIHRIVNEAINLAAQEPKGPVHINAPFREPLYPAIHEKISFSQSLKITEEISFHTAISSELRASLRKELSTYHKILIVAGQSDHNEELIASVRAFTVKSNIPVAGDITSNFHSLQGLIRHADNFLGDAGDVIKKELQPDLLITIGKSVLSKHLKLFLRNYSAKSHWHISPGGNASDTFQHLTKVIHSKPSLFFSELFQQQENEQDPTQKSYYDRWQSEEQRVLNVLNNFFPQPEFGEFEAVFEVLRHLPSGARLHLANSMSVRYANFIGIEAGRLDVQVYCNRGTSGIDGCSSTAVGHALVSDTLHVLITGDLAFFYDRNAFWHNYPVPNLRIVLLNNHGGVIFKMIDGPKELPEADEYFVTHQKLNASKLCEEHGFEYHTCKAKDMKEKIKCFFESGTRVKLLEIETNTVVSKKIFDNFKQKIKTSYEL